MAKRKAKPQGLGDTIEKVTEATGIKKLVNFIAGEDCGCDERKKKLNEIFRYSGTQCLIESEYNTLKEILTPNKYTLNTSEQTQVWRIYKRVFNDKGGMPSTCTPCWQRVVNDLNKLISTYEEN